MTQWTSLQIPCRPLFPQVRTWSAAFRGAFDSVSSNRLWLRSGSSACVPYIRLLVCLILLIVNPFQTSKTFLVTDLTAITTDPSPLVPHAENTATLRIWGQNDYSEWLIRRDYREKSVWAGFAAVGGFWTFLNGVFALLFGSSLLLILFGTFL